MQVIFKHSFAKNGPVLKTSAEEMDPLWKSAADFEAFPCPEIRKASGKRVWLCWGVIFIGERLTVSQLREGLFKMWSRNPPPPFPACCIHHPAEPHWPRAGPGTRGKLRSLKNNNRLRKRITQTNVYPSNIHKVEKALGDSCGGGAGKMSCITLQALMLKGHASSHTDWLNWWLVVNYCICNI